MSKTLVIVESPAKARTIEKYLGQGYAVESSIGHIRDLPKSASDIPEKYKGQAWARLGLNVERDFEPLYVVSPEKRQHVARLRRMASEADEIILATDDDREGESIAWHLFQELKPKVPVKRMVFHEITREAIQAAIAHPRSIDTHLVEAQEARRALDRLYGYEVSPVLWKKVAPKLSAGRVQSVATRMLVERERERMRFVSATWWDLLVTGRTADAATFPARLTDVAAPGQAPQKLAAGKDFDPLTGKLKAGADVRVLSEAEARTLAAGLTGQTLTVTSAEEKPFTQRPYPPFITSTLQQEGSRKLGFAATRTMRAAQRLYEGGYITYMRTDSTNLSAEAVNAARTQVAGMYGQPYLSPQPRVYAKKAKNAQEAHEAIRPAGSSFRTPDSLRGELGGDEWRLYDLIWKRTVACQMADARGRSLRVRLNGKAKTGEAVNLGASGRTIDFPGFLRAYVEGHDDPGAALEDRETPLPPLREGQRVTAESVKPEGHETQPPARYTEASLVQSLEGAGIGRPSTYASILGTIQDRGYATKRGQALVPTWTAFATSALLEHHFGTLVDYDFTARMEEDLDEIAGGREQRIPYLRRFYLGENGEGMALRPLIDRQMGEIDARAVATIAVPRLSGSGIEVRVGRYGPYMQRGEDKANLPGDLAPDELTTEKAEEIMSRPSGDRTLGVDEATGHPVVARAGRYGPYVTLGAQNPPVRTASLFPTDDLATLTLPRALKLLSLPRLVGTSEGEEVWAMNGKYGPYLKRGGDSRSLGSHEELFTVTLPAAEALFLQPRFGRGRTPAPPLSTYQYPGRPDIVLKSGRFGPYLTDGERNATLRKGESETTLTAERALEILEERGKAPQAKAGKPRKAAARAGAKTAARGTATRQAPPGKTAAKAPARAAAKPSGRPPGKSAARTAAPRPAATKTAATKPAGTTAAKPTFTWAQLRPHLGVLSAQERQLVTATREQGRKVDEVAGELGLDVKKARGMALQASKKLNRAARGE